MVWVLALARGPVDLKAPTPTVGVSVGATNHSPGTRLSRLRPVVVLATACLEKESSQATRRITSLQNRGLTAGGGECAAALLLEGNDKLVLVGGRECDARQWA